MRNTERREKFPFFWNLTSDFYVLGSALRLLNPLVARARRPHWSHKRPIILNPFFIGENQSFLKG